MRRGHRPRPWAGDVRRHSEWLALLFAGSLAGCGSDTPRPVAHVVTIAKVAYDPAVVDVAAGDTVEWRNRDLVSHTVTARNGAWDSSVLLPDSSWRLVVSGRDSIAYDCRLHPTMHGVVFVRSR